MRKFTTEDFSGLGHYLIRNDKPPGQFVDAGFMSTIMVKVGYCDAKEITGRRIALVDMSDGMIKLGYFNDLADPARNDNPRRIDSSTWIYVPFTDKQVLCDYLNNPDFSQEYRLATQEEVVRVVMYQKSRWER